MKKKFLIVVFYFFYFSLAAQKLSDYGWPLDPPFTISGNYGELRPNHFHAGIDFSTRNQVNLPVYSVADGYVSRIKVSPYGYGHALYITHPGGRVSVYGHLNSFSIKVAELVLKEQQLQKSFEVEILPRPQTILVRKGEIIGLSGNTGGSSGPHLHFEIRDEKSETPLNVLRLMEIPDKVRPVLQSLAVYNLADTSAPVFTGTYKMIARGDSLFGLSRTLVLDEGVIGFAFSGYDRMSSGGNANNIYAAQLYLDNTLIYGHELSGIDFSENRFVNEFSERIDRTKYQKCFMPALFPPGIYTTNLRRGRIFLRDTSVHRLKLLVWDEAGNKSVFEAGFRSTRLTGYMPPALNSDIFVKCEKDFLLLRDGIRLFIPKGTLYNSTPLVIANNISSSSRIVIFPGMNLRNAINIGFEIPVALRAKAEKLVLKNAGSVYPGLAKNDSVFFNVRSFGTFILYSDEHAPAIVYQKPHRKRRTATVRSLSYKISDKLSGISKYSVYINDKWVLAQYDAKYDLLTYTFDEQTPSGNLNVKVLTEDRVGNIAEFQHVLVR